MEWLIANLGSVRQAELQGRPHLVAPVTLIVPGVLNGSHGPLFYPADEVARSASAWNHVPIVVEHPEGGSARGPDVLNRQGVGLLLNTDVDDRGHLVSEAWFDVAATKRVEPRLLSRLSNGQQGEVSTGLQVDRQAAPAGSTHNSTPYGVIARNYRPDHLAVFVNADKKGACSIDDGCGLLVNEGIKTSDGDLSPTLTNKESDMTDDQKKAMVDELIANTCCWEEGDRTFLAGLEDAQLKRLRAVADKQEEREQVHNQATAEFSDPAGSKHTWKDGKWESAIKPPKEKVEPVTNQMPQTAQEWMDTAPPEIRNAVENAMAIEQGQREELVNQLTSNLEDNDETTALKKLLGTKSLVELRTMTPLAPGPQQGVTNWVGAAAPAPALPDMSKLPRFGAPADYLPQAD